MTYVWKASFKRPLFNTRNYGFRHTYTKQIVPKDFKEAILVPTRKKTSLDPNPGADPGFLKGGVQIRCTSKKGGGARRGSNFGPNVKKPTSWHKRGVPPGPPPLDPPLINHMWNFRPVSNLPYISKLLEKVVASQLHDHLASNSLLEPMQSAYWRLHSTETALVRMHNDLLHSIDQKKV